MNLPTCYRTLELHGDYEIRQYNYLLTAKVTVNGPYEAAYRMGSKLLTSYFKGNNYKKLPIKHGSFFMLSSRIEGWEVSCVLPQEFTVLNSPRPIGDDIKFEELVSRSVLVHSFSGRSPYSTVMNKFEKLKLWARESNFSFSKSERIVIYNSSILPFFRKNEIHVDSF